MTTTGDTMAEDVALRLRALAATRWIDRSDEATVGALLAGADEVEMLTRELDSTWRRVASDGDLIERLFAEVAGYVDRLATAEALARGAQYREREALAVVAMLRARLDGALDERDEAENAVENLAIARTIGPRFDEVARAVAIAGERERCARLCDAAATRWRSHRDVDYAARDKLRARSNEAAALAAEIRGAQADGDAHHDVLAASVGALDGVGAAGDLAGLARREAGPVTRRQWRACARCGQCFWLADDEAVPGHGVRDAWGADRACGAVVTSEGSEGR